MRRALFFLMIIAGLLTILSGIGAAHRAAAGHHAAVAGAFVLLLLAHSVTNRRAVAGYFRGKRTITK